MAGQAGRLNRRHFIASTMLAPMLGACTTPQARIPDGELAALEKRVGGRLGVHILDTGTGNAFGHRQTERFGMCSTFKMALAAIVLREGEAGRLDVNQWHRFPEAELKMSWESTRSMLNRGGMTALKMAETTQKNSDNGCANILLRLLGGPEGMTARLREIGDTVTRLDRFETEMNLVLPGEVHDTTTPLAMAQTMQRILLGNVLSTENRQLLIDWMEKTETGLKRIRAGLPSGWRAGDKTGTAVNPKMANKYNDIAIAWPPERAPLIITTYYEAPGYFDDMRDEDQAVLAEVGRIAARWVTG